MTEALNEDLTRLVEQIRIRYAKDPPHALQPVRELLEARLAGYPPEKSRAVIRQLIGHFQPAPKGSGTLDSEIMNRVFGLILGREVAPDDLSSHELLERLAQSLNTIFDALNELIGRINLSFNSGGAGSGEETIRQFIGFHLEGEDRTQSLVEYLGRINQAFLISHDAFKAAARTKVEQIIQALDPEKITAERSGGLNIGPMRKARDLDILKEKIERIRRWFDSGQFMEDFLREFEKNCQAPNRKQGGF